jgi:hypothetical protein
MLGVSFEGSFTTDDLSKEMQYFGAGRWSDRCDSGVFRISQLKIETVFSNRIGLRGSIYVQ